MAKMVKAELNAPEMANWDQVALRYGTDKASSHHGYMQTYQELLSKRKVTALLEIGVAHGKSLFTWAELMPEALIVGIDIVPECRLHQRVNIASLIADATDPAKMAAITMLHGPFDVIVDDGEHDHEQIRIAFEELYPRLPSGAIYIIEDMDADDEWVQGFAKLWGGKIIQCINKSLIVVERM